MGKKHSKHARDEAESGSARVGGAAGSSGGWAPHPMRAPTASDKQAASELRQEGNTLVKKEKYSAALERYTEALTLFPEPALHTNRAFCHKKRGDWAKVEEDSRAALELNSNFLKAHYYLGLALKKSGDLQGSVNHLTRALEQARESGDSIKDEIWRELASAKYQSWEQHSAQRRHDRARLRARLTQALALLHGSEAQSSEQPYNGGAEEQQRQQQHREEWVALEAMFNEEEARDLPGEFSNAFACRLTLEPFREPVVSTSGLSYERAALLQHLKNVGQFDPVTREPLTEKQVCLNLGLRAATQEYLDQHAWAWKDCI
mmetsp:Transcript_1914/g.5693  ORF Transcript_1914/g.5693 Transcript_1914/m.5693 type:complete len:318 (+) Transcript_1914:99-1052(+)